MNVYTVLVVSLSFHMAATVCKQSCSYCPCEVQGNPCAEMWADDCNVFINSIVNITCQLDVSYEVSNSSYLYFKSDSKSLENQHIIVVNETTAVLQHVVTTDDINNNIYCRATNVFSILPFAKIELTYIDYYPQEIVNFSCIWEGLDAGALQCFWEHPVEYRHTNFIDVSLEWKNKSEHPFQNTCSQVIDKTRCDGITGNIHGIDQFFRINVTNTELQTTTTTLIEQHYPNDIRNLYAKPYKMENLTVLEKNKTVIQLKWDIQEPATNHDNTSRMKFTIKCIVENGTRTVKTFNTSVLIEDLQTYTLYKFEVFAHYTDIFNHTRPIGLPSDSVYLQARTAQDIAKCPPRVTVGAYEYAEEVNSNVRNITVYWQNFYEMKENGPIVEFDVILKSTGGEPISHRVNSSSHHTFTHMQSVKNCIVRIKAGTTVGMSDPSNPVYIQKANSIQPPAFLLEKLNTDIVGNQIYLISWETRYFKGVNNYTIYWCERTNGCEKQIQWKTISVEETSYTVHHLDKEKNYLFGVSMDSENASTGFSWKSCYYMRNEVPPKPNSVNVQNRDQQSITVIWTRPGTCERSPFVKFYILFWCQLAKTDAECIFGTNTSTRVNTSITEVQMQYTIRNLKSGTGYVVWLIAVSSAGQQSVEGEKNYNVTTMEPSQPETSFKYLGVAIGIPVAFILLVIIILAAQIRFDLCGKIKELVKPFDIDVPTISRNDKSVMYKPCTLKLGLNGHDNKALDLSSEDNRHHVQTISESVFNEELIGSSLNSQTFTINETTLNTNQHGETGYCSPDDITGVNNTSIQYQRFVSIPDDSAPENSSSSSFPISCLTNQHEAKTNQRPEDILEGFASSSVINFENTSSHLSHSSLSIQNNEIQLELDSEEEEIQGDNKGDSIQNNSPTAISSNSGYVSDKCFLDKAPDLFSSGIGTCSPVEINSNSSSESMEFLDKRSFHAKGIDGKTSINIIEDQDYSVLHSHPVPPPDESPSITPPLLISTNNNVMLSCDDCVNHVHNPIHSIKNNIANDLSHLILEGKINNGSQIMPECIHPATNNTNDDEEEVVLESSSNENDIDIINSSTNNNIDGYVSHHYLVKPHSGGYGNNLCDPYVQGEIT
ncbi:uncharacterized protein [Mytilus edulis]|uniref:uncharacterized protein n=1 Tax=Mytilus edulis TaxID=6550 RepID=UPI0039F0CEAB